MAQYEEPTPAEIAAAELHARENAPLPWSAEAYFNVAVSPVVQHGLMQENRVGVATHAPGLYFSDYGPIGTLLDYWWGSRKAASGG